MTPKTKSSTWFSAAGGMMSDVPVFSEDCADNISSNMAYHTEDYNRIQDFDFVRGIKVVKSSNHPLTDICDELAGTYPKDFKFTGWHPFCRCHTETILKDPEEIFKDNEADYDAVINDKPLPDHEPDPLPLPENFNLWVEKDTSRIQMAGRRGTLQYFLKDNKWSCDGKRKRLHGDKKSINEDAINWNSADNRQKKNNKIRSVADAGERNIITNTTQNANHGGELIEKEAVELFKNHALPQKYLSHPELLPAVVQAMIRNLGEILRVKDNPDYVDVEFDIYTGAVKATHINHNSIKGAGGLYEQLAQSIGFSNGHSVILESEDNTKQKMKNTDGVWDGLEMEVAGCKNGTSNNIRNSLKHCAKKRTAQIAAIVISKDAEKFEMDEALKNLRG